MSQFKVIIIFSFAIFMMFSYGESKRVGCASFGHSCYGGFGKKRSDPSLNSDLTQDIETQQNQQTGPLMRIFPQPTTSESLQYVEQQEKEIKLIVLSTINQVVEETLKRISVDMEK